MSEVSRVVRPRNGGFGGTDRKMSGTRFKTYVQAAMREADDMSLAELARRSGVKERSWHDWFEGTHEPRPSSLARAGRALNRTPEQLLAAWDGQRPHKARRGTETPDALVEAITAQTDAINALVEELRLTRAGQVEATEIAFQALGALGAAQARSGTPDGSEREADAGTRR